MTPGCLDRRSFLAGVGALAFARDLKAETLSDAEAVRRVKEIEARIGGRVGVSALDTGNGARLAWRGGERFAMCSTFKWVLVASILSLVDQGKLTLDRRISYGANDMLSPDFYAPVTRAHLAEGSLTVSELCAAAVEESDNVAANLLLGISGGPAALTEFIRGQGDAVTRVDRNEPTLNTNAPGDPRDTTTPDAMIGLLGKMLTGDTLSPASRDQLTSWMKACRTGLARLRAGLPSDWTAGDKTGTGNNGAVNDVAVIWPPGRKPILVAVYLSGSRSPVATLNHAHAEIGGIVAASFG